MLKASHLKLYEHKESVCCHKVAITLAEKQINCEIVNIALENNEQKQPWFLAINALGKVPVLVHHGRVINQSSIITEYLDDAFPEPSLMPRAPYWRARRRLWARQIDDGLHSPHVSRISFVIAFGQLLRRRMDTPGKLEAYLNTIRDPGKRAHARAMFEIDMGSELMHQSLRAWDEFLGEMESALEEAPWLAGEAFSLADIDVIPYVWRLSNLELDIMWAERPRVADWFERVTARPSFKAAVIEPALPEWIETMRTTGTLAKSTLGPIIAGFGRTSAEPG